MFEAQACWENLPLQDVSFHYIFPILCATTLFDLSFVCPDSNDMVCQWWNNKHSGELHQEFKTSLHDAAGITRLFEPFPLKLINYTVDPCQWVFESYGRIRSEFVECKDGHVVGLYYHFSVSPSTDATWMISTSTIPPFLEYLRINSQQPSVTFNLDDLRSHKHLKFMCVR